MSAESTDPFASIRPYNDEEVPGVISGLLHSDELIDVLARFRFPAAYPTWGFVLRPLVRWVLGRELREVSSVRAVQERIAGYMERMIRTTTDRVTYSGLEELDPGQSYLFISNHRDIAMDPAFVNWGLYNRGMDTVRIAIGDNLLRKPYASDLMRLNKSFIVNRSAKGREKLTALLQLSAYINHSVGEGNSVWIAQREGRAKDGDDRTDPAILKMFHVSQKREKSFAQTLRDLRIVPVAISYEYDPCDAVKARELAARDEHGSYEKGQYEDMESIARGITGYKGNVHVAFGKPLTNPADDAEEVARQIDRVIHLNYRLHPTNLLAAGETEGVPADKRAAWEARVAAVPEAHRKRLVDMYARPVINQRLVQAESGREEAVNE